jgi:hypothetical protein
MQDQDPSAELRALFFNLRETRPQSHIYVVLDNACPVSPDHALSPESLPLRSIKRDYALVGGSEGPDAAQWALGLLQLCRSDENGYIDEELIDLSLQTALDRRTSINGAYVAGWVATDLDIHALAAQIDRRATMFDLSSGQSRKLRLHEPYRMALLLGNAQAPSFLASHLQGLHSWMFVDTSGHIRRINADQFSEPTLHRPTLDMCRALHRVAMGRRVVMAMIKADIAMPEHAELTIDDLLVLAQEHGLSHAEDMIFFALNALTLERSWYEHPQARRLLEQVRQEGAPLVGLFNELPPEVVEQIAAYRPGA